MTKAQFVILIFFTTLFTANPEAQTDIQTIYHANEDPYSFYLRVILNNPPEEKLEAFKLALTHNDLSRVQKGSLAEAVMEVVLSYPANARHGASQALLELASQTIRETEHAYALPLVIKYYDLAFASFRQNPAQKLPLIDAISCLGSLKNADAARALTFQLKVYNSRAAMLNSEEQEIVLALIRALGELRYRASYETINEAFSLPYPEAIKNEAGEALSKLR